MFNLGQVVALEADIQRVRFGAGEKGILIIIPSDTKGIVIGHTNVGNYAVHFPRFTDPNLDGDYTEQNKLMSGIGVTCHAHELVAVLPQEGDRSSGPDIQTEIGKIIEEIPKPDCPRCHGKKRIRGQDCPTCEGTGKEPD